jgi:hypothetical protein
MYDKNIILVDVDGVLLDWEWAFSIWLSERGYTHRSDAKQYYSISDQFDGVSESDAKKFTRLFNESAAVGFLPPLRDSVYWVKRLHEQHGYRFRAITSLSTDKNAQKLREMNLRKLFGRTAFESVTCLETGSDKHEALEPYRGSGLWWVEDKISNADLGHELGLRSLLLEHGHNMKHECPYPIVKNWQEIYGIITGKSRDNSIYDL